MHMFICCWGGYVWGYVGTGQQRVCCCWGIGKGASSWDLVAVKAEEVDIDEEEAAFFFVLPVTLRAVFMSMAMPSSAAFAMAFNAASRLRSRQRR